MTVASGILTYTHPVASARSADLWFEDTTGWKWDNRTWFSESTDNWAAFVPANWDPTTSGVTPSYFQSGIGSNRDLELISVQDVPSSGMLNRIIYNPWSPEVYHGYYYDYAERGYLYGDASEVAYPTYRGIAQNTGYGVTSGFNEVALLSLPKIGVPIRAEQYNGTVTMENSLSMTNIGRR